MEKNELVVVVEESGLEITQSEHILNNFTEFFKRAKQWEVEARSLTVSDVSEVDKMAKAREVRLSLREIRVEAEKTRKSLKEKALREGKAIDGVANVIKALIEPLEEHLEAQEKFAENIKKQEEERKLRERTELVSSLGGDPYMYNIKDMGDEIFDKLVENLKKQKADKEEEARLAEEKRLKEIEEKRLEDERIRKENEELKKQKEEDDKKRKIEEEERKKKEEKDKKEKKELEDKLKAKEEEERKQKEAEEKKKKEEEELERQKKLAPEKEKLFAWSEQIKSIEVPDGLSKAGLQIVKEAEEALLKISQDIKLKIKNL